MSWRVVEECLNRMTRTIEIEVKKIWRHRSCEGHSMLFMFLPVVNGALHTPTVTHRHLRRITAVNYQHEKSGNIFSYMWFRREISVISLFSYFTIAGCCTWQHILSCWNEHAKVDNVYSHGRLNGTIRHLMKYSWYCMSHVCHQY